MGLYTLGKNQLITKIRILCFSAHNLSLKLIHMGSIKYQGQETSLLNMSLFYPHLTEVNYLSDLN